MHTLPTLPYAYDALTPHIDAQTMKIHHDLHHAGYVNKLNAALEGHADLQSKPIEELLINLNDIPEDIRTAVKNNGGGHYNHSFFWPLMTPESEKMPQGSLAEAIKTSFGGYDAFKELFSQKAATLFGSGWAWLVVNKENKLEVLQSANQECPLSSGLKPILTLDVWEHAYYLNYQNRRPEYIEAWWNVINWAKADEHYKKATS